MRKELNRASLGRRRVEVITESGVWLRVYEFRTDGMDGSTGT